MDRLIIHSGAVPPPASDFFVNYGARQQVIDGFGAANPHQGLTSTLADLFFTTIGLTLLRLPFSSGGSGAYASETSTFYADAALAAARGAQVWAAPWTAPDPTWKDNGSLVQGHLLSGHYADMASYQAGLKADLAVNGGTPLFGMSVVNEPDLANGAVGYESEQMTAAEMVAYIKNNLGPALAALSPRPLLIAPECENWDNSVSYVSTILADPAAAAFVDIFATHRYEGTVVPLNTNKRVWQTEMSFIAGGPYDPSGTFDAGISKALVMAQWIHDDLTIGGVNAWHSWWARDNQANNLGLIGNAGDDTITKRLYALGNFAKFVRPGHSRVTVTGTLSGVSLSAYVEPFSKKLVMVAINSNGSSQAMSVYGAGFQMGTMTPYVTSATQDLAQVSDVTATAGLLSVTLPASSVTTFVGTGG